MKKKMYTEKECAYIFKQILEVVNYLYAHGVYHRDLKPENILFSMIKENALHSTGESLKEKWNHIKEYSKLDLV